MRFAFASKSSENFTVYQQELAAIWSMGFDADVVQVWFGFNPNFGLGLTSTLTQTFF